MKVPAQIEDDLENQTGMYVTRVALTDEPEIAPVAILIFKDFDAAGVPRQNQTLFLSAATVAQIKALNIPTPMAKALTNESNGAAPAEQQPAGLPAYAN